MVKQERARVTREEILEAAGQVFSEYSFTEAKLSDVYERTEAGRGALFFHFQSKHGLARAVLLAGREQLQQVALKALSVEGDARVRLLALTSSIANLISTSAVVSASFQLTAQAAREFPDLAGDPYSMWEPMIRQLLGSASEAGDLRDGVSIDALTWIIIATFMGSKEILGLRGELTQLPARVEVAMTSILGQYFN